MSESAAQSAPYFQDVLDFHLQFGLPVSSHPATLTTTRVAARTKWLREEVEEFATAKSLVEQIDAAIDVIYVAIGCLVEMGVELDGAFKCVHASNLEKRWADGSVRTDSDGKLLKPHDWVGPEEAIRNWLAIASSGRSTA